MSRSCATVDILLDESGWVIEDLAKNAHLTVERAAAIAMGRWTPSSQERQRIAGAFGVPADQISWGHTMDPRNIRYRRRGMRENF